MDDLFLALCIVVAFASGFLPGYLLGLRRALQVLDEIQQTFDEKDGRDD